MLGCDLGTELWGPPYAPMPAPLLCTMLLLLEETGVVVVVGVLWCCNASRTMKWSFVSLTLWCARTQLSHRYSLHSLHWQLALLPSSHEEHILSLLRVDRSPRTVGSKSSSGVMTSTMLLIKKFEGRQSTPVSGARGTSWPQVGQRSPWPWLLRTVSSRHRRQNVWRHGSSRGSSKRLKQSVHDNCSLNSARLAITLGGRACAARRALQWKKCFATTSIFLKTRSLQPVFSFTPCSPRVFQVSTAFQSVHEKVAASLLSRSVRVLSWTAHFDGQQTHHCMSLLCRCGR